MLNLSLQAGSQKYNARASGDSHENEPASTRSVGGRGCRLFRARYFVSLLAGLAESQ